VLGRVQALPQRLAHLLDPETATGFKIAD